MIAKESKETMGCLLKIVLSFLFLFSFSLTAQAQDYASKQRSRAATAYYARSRAMLVEALEEFEQGRKYARPDLVVDSEEWRLTLISLTEQLNRLIDPKPLVTRDGIVINANPRLIRRESQRLPEVKDGARASNVIGEHKRMKSAQSARSKMYEDKQQGLPTDNETEVAKEEPLSPEAKRGQTKEIILPEEEVKEEIPKAKELSKEQLVPEKEDTATQTQSSSSIVKEETIEKEVSSIPIQETTSEALPVVKEETTAKNTTNPNLDEKTEEAIEKLVKDRLKNLESSSENTPSATIQEGTNEQENLVSDKVSNEEKVVVESSKSEDFE